ncbi:MAG: protein kinase domain-containing protein [Promethearchaeota archaeon]
MVKYKVGDVIGDKYKVLKIIGGEGESGRGIILICSEEGGSILALKALQEKYLNSEAMDQAFKREALAWVHLDAHPYIVRAYYVINIENIMYVAMEYIAPDSKGRNTLTHFFEKPIPLKKTLKWAIQICQGMEYSFSKGISPHRDIKPDNIMITSEGNVKITDFGLVKFLGEEDNIASWLEIAESGKSQDHSFLRLSQQEKIGGTVPWMAPEQFEGKPDVRSDIYSFGICLYQMVNNGKLPFYYGSIEDYYYAHKGEYPKKLNTIIWPIIERCLQKKPNNRYQNFVTLRKDLEIYYIKEVRKEPPQPPKAKRLEAWEHNNKGVSFATLGLKNEAATEFKQSLRIDPDYATAYNNLGKIYEDKHLYDKAIEEYRAAVQIKPRSAKFRNNLASLLEKTGEIQKALDEFRQMIRIKPHYIEGHYNLGRMYKLLGKYDDAKCMFKNFIEYAPAKHQNYKDKVKEARKSIKELKKLIKQEKKNCKPD